MKPATVIASRFEIHAKISQRSGSLVYSGRDLKTDLPVAIKLFEVGEAKAERFEREATLLTEFSHPAIVQYIAHGAIGDKLFLVMEWVKGPTLAQVMDRGLMVGESVLVVHGISEALATVHRRGVVHRDIKPSNIMFPSARLDEVKLLDFGVARRVGQRSSMTRTGAIVGTPAYMSPEQAHGAWDVDARSDVFSLGCVLYACLSGQPAFAASHLLATLTAILFLDPVPLVSLCPDAPAALCDLVARMLAKDPAQRPASAAEVAAELAALGDLPEGERRPFRLSIPRRTTHHNEDTISTQTSFDAATRQARGDAPLFLLAALEEGINDEDSDEADEEADTDVEDSPAEGIDELVAEARKEVSGHGGLSALLTDGTFVAMFTGGDDATAPSIRIARCALSLRRFLPRISMVIGRGDASSVVSVLDRLVETLVEESFRGYALDVSSEVARRPIRLDDRSTAQLEAHGFDVERIAGASYLIEKPDSVR